MSGPDRLPGPAPRSPGRRYAVILNPAAGGGLARRVWPRLEAELRRRELDFTLIREASGEAALARVRALPADVALLAVGGDGTVGAVLPAVARTGRPLGIVPLGTGNDLAGHLGLLPGRFTQALDRLELEPRPVDALQVELRAGHGAGSSAVLLNGLGQGFDAQVSANMGRVPARLPGLARYAWSALATLRTLRLHEVEVVVDGAELYAGPSALVAVMNGTRYGGGFQISPASDLHDGQLNVLASGPVGRRQLLGLMGLVLRGRHLGRPGVHHVAGRSVQIRWSRPVALHLDGDLRGEVQELQVTVLPGAVHLFTG